jgi:hypothetical protein
MRSGLSMTSVLSFESIARIGVARASDGSGLDVQLSKLRRMAGAHVLEES